MPTTALLADLHSNLEATRACLAHARERGAERYVFLGDLVGYNADPGAVIEIVREYVAAGALVVKGNHDDAVVREHSYHDDAINRVLDWTRRVLSASDLAFLAELPMIERVGDVCYVHASADAPEAFSYVDHVDAAQRSMAATDAWLTCCGHFHTQTLFYETLRGRGALFEPSAGTPIRLSRRRRWHAVVGSVGQPRDRNPAANYALFDPATDQLTFQRVAYEVTTAARKVRGAGLPEVFAFRLEIGA